jgi:hypothetical protein
MVPVKKILAFLLTLAFVGSLSIATTGCGKKADEKKASPPPDTKKEDTKKT